MYKSLKANANECPVCDTQTSSTAFTTPSFSGLLVTCNAGTVVYSHIRSVKFCSRGRYSKGGRRLTWAYLPHTTLPPGVTKPSSLTLTSMMVPLVSTPSCV